MIVFWFGFGVGVAVALVAILGLDMYLSRRDRDDPNIVYSHRAPKL